MASSSLPSRNAPATAGANCRDCLRAALNAIQRSIITPIDHADMMKRMITTMRAGQFICRHSEIGSQPTAAFSSPWKSQKAKMCALAKRRVARFATNMSLSFPPQETFQKLSKQNRSTIRSIETPQEIALSYNSLEDLPGLGSRERLASPAAPDP